MFVFGGLRSHTKDALGLLQSWRLWKVFEFWFVGSVHDDWWEFQRPAGSLSEHRNLELQHRDVESESGSWVHWSEKKKQGQLFPDFSESNWQGYIMFWEVFAISCGAADLVQSESFLWEKYSTPVKFVCVTPRNSNTLQTFLSPRHENIEQIKNCLICCCWQNGIRIKQVCGSSLRPQVDVQCSKDLMMPSEKTGAQDQCQLIHCFLTVTCTPRNKQICCFSTFWKSE